MFQQLMNSMKLTASNDDKDTRRAHERREQDHCIAVIDDVTFPIQNWSKGGILLQGDDRTFAVEDVKQVTIRFKMADRVMDVTHKGQIIRKGRDKFVIQFYPLTQNVDNQFNSVVNDYIAQEFANSQA